MTIKEKLEAMKAIEDKNRAVDQAFILGQQSVQPMREFSYDQLKMLAKVLIDRRLVQKISLGDFSWNFEFVQHLDELIEQIQKEMNRRDER